MHHLFPQPINSPSATSLPTKSRIITYSPFFSLHHSWWSPKRFFLALLFLSSKISTFRRYETVELSPYNPTPQRELKSGLKSHEFNARLQWAKPESEDGGGVRPQAQEVGWVVDCCWLQNPYLWKKISKTGRMGETACCFRQDFSPSTTGFWAERKNHPQKSHYYKPKRPISPNVEGSLSKNPQQKIPRKKSEVFFSPMAWRCHFPSGRMSSPSSSSWHLSHVQVARGTSPHRGNWGGGKTLSPLLKVWRFWTLSMCFLCIWKLFFFASRWMFLASNLFLIKDSACFERIFIALLDIGHHLSLLMLIDCLTNPPWHTFLTEIAYHQEAFFCKGTPVNFITFFRRIFFVVFTGHLQGSLWNLWN